MPFGQILLGPPGSGKTTYVQRFYSLYESMHRPVLSLNLDPANDPSDFIFDIDIRTLVDLKEVMDEFGLGPNAGMIYCMEFLEQNMDWLLDQLKEATKDGDKYLLIDCPGQVELFTHHPSLKNILYILSKQDIRLCAVHLVDSYHCVDLARYISMLLLSLQSMLQLELPHINVLSKVDLMKAYGKPKFNLEFYTQVDDLDYLLQALSLDASIPSKFQSLTSSLTSLIQDFGLLGFQTLCIDDPKSVLSIARLVDKANGYALGGLTPGNESLFETVMSLQSGEQDIREVQEKYWDEDESQFEENELLNEEL